MKAYKWIIKIYMCHNKIFTHMVDLEKILIDDTAQR